MDNAGNQRRLDTEMRSCDKKVCVCIPPTERHKMAYRFTDFQPDLQPQGPNSNEPRLDICLLEVGEKQLYTVPKFSSSECQLEEDEV